MTIGKILAMLVFTMLFVGTSSILAGSGKSGCVTWKAEARYVGLGYNHLVHLKSECEKPMTCKVSTDVNPEPQVVKIEPKASKTVTTFVGSPASEFKATVECAP